ncbi:chitinase [Planosporangium mesophilum]|uniref:chitinase n=1 Tax=Planosporangium mesophilum TaxID=689768 RepID=A0A8J3T923_9ACTN|nr:glycosyl hydrolase family 18 protein [Planosporangium mesophilum]NJC86081.1 chitinase [Planosporangium mesophilum]GII21512.1 chitinase [Planosporangium mesophilum]
MRGYRYVLAASTVAATVTGAVVLIVGPVAAATNTIANPGFESGLAGWSCPATATAVTGHAHSGSYALQGAASSNDNAQCTQTVAVAPNTTYTLSAYVNGAYVYLGATGTGGADPSTWTPGTGGGYQQLSVTFTTGAGTRSVTVYLHGWYGQGSYYADDVTMPGPGGTPPPPATPTPTPSTSPTTAPPPPPPPPGGGPLPRHELTGYWQNFNNGAAVQRLRDVAGDYDLIAVAFADTDPSGPGKVTFNVDSGLSSALGAYTNADLKTDVATLHSRGKKVVISVGGQNGTVSVGDPAAANNFATSVYNLMQAYGFDGVDIDLENGVNPDQMASALRTLRSRAGSGLVITMAPETIFMQSASSTYLSLALKIKDILTVVHTQYYNSGSMNGCDGNVYSQGTVDFITAQACIAIQAGLRPDQVAIGLPASSRAAGSGYVDPSVVNNALDCLARGTGCGRFRPATPWPDIRGAMTWSTNWDTSAGGNWSRSVKGHLGTLP